MLSTQEVLWPFKNLVMENKELEIKKKTINQEQFDQKSGLLMSHRHPFPKFWRNDK